MKASPLSLVKKNFGDRAKLVDQLAGMVDMHHGDTSKEQVRARLMGLPNNKLLRLYTVEQKIRERFGDKAKLIDHIVGERKKAGLTADESFKTKISAYSKAQLLDLTNMNLGERPKKQTPAERLAKKRGRKQRERAQSKLKG